MRRFVASSAVALFVSILPTPPAIAADLAGRCRGDLPVHVGEPLTWRAQPSGGSGDFSFAWSGDVSGTTRVRSQAYGSIGPKFGNVTITDDITGQSVTASCMMHVIPSAFVEPPSVTPVLWVPSGVDADPMIEHLRRAWRWVRTIFFDQYGKTFRMRPLVTIESTQTERDICGGDCTDLGRADLLMDRAQADASAAIGGTIEYARTFLVSVWGAGGWAGSYSWDLARGGVGDWALAPVVGRLVPPVEPDVDEGFLNELGRYTPAVSTIAHEVNHLIAWDDPHDYSIFRAPGAYDRAVALAGPFLTQNLADSTGPSVAFQQPASQETVSGITQVQLSASDATGVEAVRLLVDGQPFAIDTSAPFSFRLDTTLVGADEHRLEAIAFDPAGNATTVGRTVFVENLPLPVSSCPTAFPTGTFIACFYDGVNSTASFLGAEIDHPFPVPSRNVGFGPSRFWADGITFGQADHITGIWRGTLDLHPDRYHFRVFADDGIRVRVDGVTIVDELRSPQVATFDRIVDVDGPTQILIRWFEDDGGQGLDFRWWPTAG